MAMNGTDLGDAIAKIITSPSAPPDMVESIKAQWEKIGAAIVKHIQDNAEVLSGIPVSTSGGPSAQTGQTTDKGKIQ